MDWEFDSTFVLYGLGVILGIASLIYFGSELILGLSPTVKSILLFLLFVIFLAYANYASNRTVTTTIAYVLSSASYVVMLVFVIGKFDLGTDTVFLLLAVSSALFIGLGYLVRERGFSLEKRQVKVVVSVAVVLGLLLIAVDTMGPEVMYTLELEESVNVSKDGRVGLGELRMENRFWLSRDLDVPTYRACIYGDDGEMEDTFVNIEGNRYEILGGREARVLDVSMYSTGLRVPSGEERPKYRGVFDVERAGSCPDSAVRKIVVTRNEGSLRYY